MGLIRKEDIHESLLNSLSNPNLLINGDFQVWQRGTSFNCANIYTADRWKTNFNATVTNQNGKAHVHANEQFGGLIQFIEFDHIKQFIQGRDISGTIKLNVISGDVTFVVQFIPKSSAPTIAKNITVNNGVNSLTLTAPDNLDNYKTFECLVYGNPNAEYEIEYMKVELGSTPTPFVPRLFAEELALCQRYFQRLAIPQIPYITDANQLEIPIKLHCPMRKSPTLKWDQLGYLHAVNGSDVKTLCSDINNPEVNPINNGGDYLAEYHLTLIVSFKVTVPEGALWIINRSPVASNRLASPSFLDADAEIY